MQWQELAVNGAVADTLVENFGGATGTPSSLPQDQQICLRVDYSSDAQTQVILYLAVSNAAADENIIMLHDSRTEPVPDTTQWLTDIVTIVPFLNNLPYQLRITKGASDAFVRWYWFASMGPGC